MSGIQYYLGLLKSDDHNKRYDACEQLRIWPPPLPQDAFDALTMAANDANLDVANAARRALSLHRQVVKEQTQVLTEIPENTVKNWLLIGLIAGLIPGVVLFIWIVLIVNNDMIYPILLGFPGIPCGIIGASWGRQNKTTAWARALFVAIIGVGFWFWFALALCLFCM